MLKRIAAPMVGGLITSAGLTLIVLPVIYSLWRERQVRKIGLQDAEAAPIPYEAPVPLSQILG